MRNDKENVIVDKTINFSLSIIKYCEALEQAKKYVIAKQLLRSGTSIGANVFEAQNAESKADFIHKMKIAAKEASETLYWLILCERSESYSFNKQLRNDLDEIIKILSKIIASSKNGFRNFVWLIGFAFSNFQIAKFSNF
jgi:four helix bundle protein